MRILRILYNFACILLNKFNPFRPILWPVSTHPCPFIPILWPVLTHPFTVYSMQLPKTRSVFCCVAWRLSVSDQQQQPFIRCVKSFIATVGDNGKWTRKQHYCHFEGRSKLVGAWRPTVKAYSIDSIDRLDYTNNEQQISLLSVKNQPYTESFPLLSSGSAWQKR